MSPVPNTAGSPYGVILPAGRRPVPGGWAGRGAAIAGGPSGRAAREDDVVL
ncbi:MAG: hypothetical protein AVDCRST_MAG01-01-234 [uncultured Rubrobacteraceae bacterium]|uniref:Uncharacterized protein n=1 Tax=uncultured Rubrobacteraceae bacterium TaxID=349277 RepID=A0A6J4NL33_9ACTN|nr:MAG: hypothetical protein AVDCRST_MAG01-01-234 [uncultured Rubrobacteraceae bacterium]